MQYRDSDLIHILKIIPMYFEDRKGIEAIAEELGVERTTILRNKKRLCLAIYNEII